MRPVCKLEDSKSPRQQFSTLCPGGRKIPPQFLSGLGDKAVWEQSPHSPLHPMLRASQKWDLSPGCAWAVHSFAGFLLPLPVIEGPHAFTARAASLRCPGCAPHAHVGTRLSPCALLHSYPSWLQGMSNAPALKESLLAVSSVLCQTPLRHLLCASCASIPTRYWHWQRVTEENDGLSMALFFFNNPMILYFVLQHKESPEAVEW